MYFDFDQYGSAFLDMRLHKLRRLITEQSEALFERHGVKIPSPCASVVLYLRDQKTASIAQVANATGYTHQLISQRLRQLERLGFTKRIADERDARRLMISLTPAGVRQAKKLEGALLAAACIFDKFFEEIGCNLYDTLAEAEDRLAREPLTARQ